LGENPTGAHFILPVPDIQNKRLWVGSYTMSFLPLTLKASSRTWLRCRWLHMDLKSQVRWIHPGSMSHGTCVLVPEGETSFPENLNGDALLQRPLALSQILLLRQSLTLGTLKAFTEL